MKNLKNNVTINVLRSIVIKNGKKNDLNNLTSNFIFFYFLIHALNNDLWEKHKKIGTYEFLKKKQAEGKIRKLRMF